LVLIFPNSAQADFGLKICILQGSVAMCLGVVGSLVTFLLQIVFRVCRWKNSENCSVFSKDIDQNFVACYLAHTVDY